MTRTHYAGLELAKQGVKPMQLPNFRTLPILSRDIVFMFRLGSSHMGKGSDDVETQSQILLYAPLM